MCVRSGKGEVKEGKMTFSVQISEDPNAVNQSRHRFDPHLKIWPAASLLSSYLSHLAPFPTSSRVLELGSGTGAVGLHLSHLFTLERVTLTDLPCAMPALLQNISANTEKGVCTVTGTPVECRVLEWGCDPHSHPNPDVIVCSDVVYFRHLFSPLLKTLKHLCTPRKTRLLLAYCRRNDVVEQEFFQEFGRWFEMTEHVSDGGDWTKGFDPGDFYMIEARLRSQPKDTDCTFAEWQYLRMMMSEG